MWNWQYQINTNSDPDGNQVNRDQNIGSNKRSKLIKPNGAENHHGLQKSNEKKVPVEEHLIDSDILSNKKTVIKKEVNAKYNNNEEDKLTHMEITNQKIIQNCEILDKELNAEKGDEKEKKVRIKHQPLATDLKHV